MEAIKFHGWFMWAAWGVLAMIQLASNRYLKCFWTVRMWVHRIVGTLMLLITIGFGLLGIKVSYWSLSSDDPHLIIGQIIFFSVVFVALGGIFARSRSVRVEWNTKYVLRVQTIHKVAGRLLIILSQVSILLGVLLYNKWFAPSVENQSNLGYVHIITFFVIWGLVELLFQIYKGREQSFKIPSVIMTTEEFNARIEKGDALVILDNLILDVTHFQQEHPGGRFLVAHNIGRDITKYFYGGYGVENFNGKPKTNKHSNVARSIVNQLIIAKLDDNSDIITCRVINRDVVNEKVTTFTFSKQTNTLKSEVEQNQVQQASLSQYYQDISQIGKHYLVSAKKHHFKKRQYTNAQVMDKALYDEYLKALRTPNYKISENLLKESEKKITLTVKNYSKSSALSTQIHGCREEDEFELQGPNGKGLSINETGTHIAFTAGTGILVFVDLLAYLARKNLGQLSPGEDKQTDRSFRFILFASFASEEESTAFELCQALNNYCIDHGKRNFEFYCRFSNQNSEKWEKVFIDQTLEQYQEVVKKIWVCGTPQMNETFDKCLSQLYQKYNFSKSVYEIL